MTEARTNMDDSLGVVLGYIRFICGKNKIKVK